MKHADIERIHAAGFITDEQRQKIIGHFKLEEEGGNRFLAIISFIGAVLIASGIILLISAHWNEIPRGVKIFAGVLLMLGAHVGGWWLREVKGNYRKTGEALHLVGSGLFLANIALLGQIYNLVSRPPNAFLLWWLGIAALPWLLRSRAQHLLSLLVFGLWFGLEINMRDSLVFFGNDEYQILLYAMLGLIYLGLGYVLRGTSFAGFSADTEKLGLLGFLGFAFPLTFGIWEHRSTDSANPACSWIFPVMAALAAGLAAAGVRRLKELDGQWRLTWFFTLAGGAALLAAQMYFAPQSDWNYGWHDAGFHWIAVIGLFVFCLLQIQVGVLLRMPGMVNLGVAFIAADIITTYIRLIGTMARTGVMFLISGVFLIVFAVFLEKKRRRLMHKIKNASARPEVQP